MPIINSLLDNDYYAFTTQQLLFHKFSTIHSVSEFKCRSGENLSYLKDDIQTEVDHLLKLKFTNPERNFLYETEAFKDDYLLALRTFTFDGVHVNISTNALKLVIKISGLEWKCILLETPILAIVSELYFRDKPSITWAPRLSTKINKLHTLNNNNFKFIEFGTRRRCSLKEHRYVLNELKRMAPNNLLGTSNVMLAMELGIKPMGTMGHRYLQLFQGIVHPRISQAVALSEWMVEYEGKLGIALTDTIGIDAFLNDYTLAYAKVYDGLRHDSGDPYAWGDKVITHYEELDIDPMDKTLVFSDGLDKATGLIKETDVSTLDSLAISNTDWSNLSLYSR